MSHGSGDGEGTTRDPRVFATLYLSVHSKRLCNVDSGVDTHMCIHIHMRINPTIMIAGLLFRLPAPRVSRNEKTHATTLRTPVWKTS